MDKSKKMSIALALCIAGSFSLAGNFFMGGIAEAGEQTVTAFSKTGELDGKKPSFGHLKEMKNANVWDAEHNAYVFTKDTEFTGSF